MPAYRGAKKKKPAKRKRVDPRPGIDIGLDYHPRAFQRIKNTGKASERNSPQKAKKRKKRS